MGKQHRDNKKNLLGKPNVVGLDVFTWAATGIFGVVGTTSLTDRGGNSLNSCIRGGTLEFLKADLGTVLASGQMTVQVLKNSTPIATGTFTTTSPAFAEWVFGTDQNFAGVTVASGDTLSARYAVQTSLNASRGITVTAGVKDTEV